MSDEDKSMPKQAYINPDAALATAVFESSKSDRIAKRIPNLQIGALIMLGLIAFSVLQALLMKSVLVSTLGSGQDMKGFLTVTTVLGWIIGATISIWLLFTKSVKMAQWLVLVFGITLTYYTVLELIHFNPIGLAIDGFILWKTFEVYESLSTLSS